jgi:hypothetical protein
MIQRVFLLVILASGISCNTINNLKRKYFTNIIPNEKTIQSMVYMPLDSSYHLYIRSICRPKPGSNFYTSRNPDDPASVIRCNCEEVPADIPKEKMELQYLLYSASKRSVFYITTIPSYLFKKEKKGIYDMPLYNIDSFLNVKGFNTFFLCRVYDNKIEFPDNTKSWEYDISPNGNYITINTVDTNIVDHSLAFPIRFYKRDSWSMGFNDNFRDSTLATPATHMIKERGLYFSTIKVGSNKPPFPFFAFKTAFAHKKESDYYWLYFRPVRLKQKGHNFLSKIPQ